MLWPASNTSYREFYLHSQNQNHLAVFFVHIGEVQGLCRGYGESAWGEEGPEAQRFQSHKQLPVPISIPVQSAVLQSDSDFVYI